jgi:hypothetical protein
LNRFINAVEQAGGQDGLPLPGLAPFDRLAVSGSPIEGNIYAMMFFIDHQIITVCDCSPAHYKKAQ